MKTTDDIKDIFLNSFPENNISEIKDVCSTLEDILNEMLVLGYRERTIEDYKYHFTRMVELSKITHLKDLDRETLLMYLRLNNVKSSAKIIRLKAIRSVLNRMYKKQLLPYDFWSTIRIVEDFEIKEGIKEKELIELIKHLDFDNFVEYRDACVFILVWETGVRLSTVSKLKKDMIDHEKLLINFTGDIMKNHVPLTLPISKNLSEMLKHLNNR